MNPNLMEDDIKRTLSENWKYLRMESSSCRRPRIGNISGWNSHVVEGSEQNFSQCIENAQAVLPNHLFNVRPQVRSASAQKKLIPAFNRYFG
jgi:hypothetical protein